MKIQRAVTGTNPIVLSIAAQPRPEDAVLAVYSTLEEAGRDGDLIGQSPATTPQPTASEDTHQMTRVYPRANSAPHHTAT